MSALRPRTLMGLALIVAGTGACRCQEAPADQDAGPDASDGAQPDARLPDARTDAGPDAQADAQVLPDAILHGFCNDPFFKLPIDGTSERTNDIAMHDGRIVWSKSKDPTLTLAGEIHLLDLETCVETQLTSGAQTAFVHIRGENIVWDDRRDGWDPWCSELYQFNIGNGEEERLTETTACELEPRTNGRHVAYRRTVTITDAPSLRLLDRQSGVDIELSPDWTNIESFDINERYVVWVAYTQDSQSVGRDVFYHDLGTGQTHHIDATYPRYQYWVFLWEDWVTIRGSDAHLSGPKYLSLYNLVSNAEVSLVEADFAVSAGWISEGVIALNTSLYTGTALLNPSDIELHEIASGSSRRLTTAESNLRVQALEPPFHLFIHRLFLPDSFQNDFYIANLEALGVLDASGMLLPGDPVIDPP